MRAFNSGESDREEEGGGGGEAGGRGSIYPLSFYIYLCLLPVREAVPVFGPQVMVIPVEGADLGQVCVIERQHGACSEVGAHLVFVERHGHRGNPSLRAPLQAHRRDAALRLIQPVLPRNALQYRVFEHLHLVCPHKFAVPQRRVRLELDLVHLTVLQQPPLLQVHMRLVLHHGRLHRRPAQQLVQQLHLRVAHADVLHQPVAHKLLHRRPGLVDRHLHVKVRGRPRPVQVLPLHARHTRAHVRLVLLRQPLVAQVVFGEGDVHEGRGPVQQVQVYVVHVEVEQRLLARLPDVLFAVVRVVQLRRQPQLVTRHLLVRDRLRHRGADLRLVQVVLRTVDHATPQVDPLTHKPLHVARLCLLREACPCEGTHAYHGHRLRVRAQRAVWQRRWGCLREQGGASLEHRVRVGRRERERERCAYVRVFKVRITGPF
eukprot:Rhum_TRINITY_DN14753_c27_g1::Rhum_TRINITY_DN14753_c27_g1_i1::g.118599::m.118599